MGKFIILLCALFQCSIPVIGSGLVDKIDYFPKEQANRINQLCEELESKYFISTLICIHQGEEPKVPKTSRSSFHFLFIKIDTKKKQVKLSTINVSQGEQTRWKNLFNRSIGTPLKRNEAIYDGLVNSLEKIIQNKKQTKHNIEKSFEAQEAKRRFSSKLKNLLWIYFWLILGFVLSYTYKSLKKGNRFENVEYYGLSRLSVLASIILGIADFAIATSIILTLPEQNEQIIALIGFFFAFYPFLILTAGILVFFLDLRRAYKFRTPNSELSLGAKLFLLNPKIPTEFLLEVNFYQLITQKILELNIDAYENYDRSVSCYYVQINQFPLGLSDSLMVFFQKHEENTLNLEYYLRLVYRQFGRFKPYRKDYITKELLDTGMISPWDWVTNRFNLNRDGESEKYRVMKEVNHQNELLQKALSNTHNTKEIIQSFTKDLLINPQLEKSLYDLRSKLYQNGLLAWAKTLDMGIFFNESFDFFEFNRRLYHAYYYKMDWSKTPDVTRWVIPV